MRQLLLSLCLVACCCGLAGAEEKEEGFTPLFDGKTMDGWQGDLKGYDVINGELVCKGGKLFTDKEYKDFVLRLEFKVPPGGNNGVGLRSPLEGDPAYVGMEIQVLDDDAEQYKSLKPYQYCGSIYGVCACERGHTKKAGEWNEEEITCKGSQVTIKMNGKVIVDFDISKPVEEGKTIDGADHPGLKRTSGHIGFLGHGSPVSFRNVRIKELK